MMLKVLVLEDEHYTLRFLEKLIAEHPKVEQVVGTRSVRMRFVWPAKSLRHCIFGY